MKKPVQFTLIHKVTKQQKDFISYRTTPILDDVCEWVVIGEGVKQYLPMWDVWEDKRYEARLRLWKYLVCNIQGREESKYQPYKNSEIGKTIPILNF